MKIAGIDNDSLKDLTQIDGSSEFAQVIRNVILSLKPTRIIETGTYLGLGTTRTIAEALKEVGNKDALFLSIEVNRANLQRAAENLLRNSLLEWVRLLNGLSVPRSYLPSEQKIQEEFVDNPRFRDVFVDHRETERARLYFAETDFVDVEADLLGRALEAFHFCPEFVLLDSGGHLGMVEFDYLISKLQAPCFLALDDIYHVKHHGSFLRIQSDPRFNVIVSSREKFGFCLAFFDPRIRASR